MWNSGIFDTFVAVAEAESLTVAAKTKLHTSQPSLSRQIRDLEEEIDAQLLTRGARGIELTARVEFFSITPAWSFRRSMQQPRLHAGSLIREAVLRHGLSHRTRTDVDARSFKDLARRAA